MPLVWTPPPSKGAQTFLIFKERRHFPKFVYKGVISEKARRYTFEQSGVDFGITYFQASRFFTMNYAIPFSKLFLLFYSQC